MGGAADPERKNKAHTHDPIENTINGLLNQNLDDSALDHILKFKTTDAYKKNLDWVAKGLNVVTPVDLEDRNPHRRMSDFNQHQAKLEEMIAHKQSGS